jgi:site-specific recombinase XerD
MLPTDPATLPHDVGIIQRTPRVPTLDGIHLNWLIEQYIKSCRERLDRQLTVDVYEDKLQWFVRWWEAEGPACGWLLRAMDLDRFERHLRDVVSDHTKNKLAYNSRNDVLRRLRKVFRWAHDNGYVDRNYASWVPVAHGGPPTRIAVRAPSLQRLLAAATGGDNSLRDRAILALLIGMGLRRSEVVSLDVEAMVMDEDYSGYARIVGKKTQANPNGVRQAAFDSVTGAILATYLVDYGHKDGPLFRNRSGRRLSDHWVYVIVKSAIGRAGLGSEIQACHDLRRAFVTHYRRQQGDKDLLRRQLGHAHSSTTDIYTLLEIEDVRRGLISPLSPPVDVAPKTEAY